MPETREPHKGRGVPKETPAEYSIADLHEILAQHFPDSPWDRLMSELERREFFAASMQQQIRILGETAAFLLENAHDTADLIPALASSPEEKIRGMAAFAVPPAYPDDLGRQLQSLRFSGSLKGIWRRELSATVLHTLIIERGVKTVLPRVQDWNRDPVPAVRRLVVESFRPRGVMLAHIAELKQDPGPLKELLEPLLDDGAGYVRKAVANNLNDVSRDWPDRVLAWAGEWLGHDASTGRRWILIRALRTLVNESHPDALELRGYTPAAEISVAWRNTTPKKVAINQLVPFEFEISHREGKEATVILLLLMDGPGKGGGRRKSRYQIWQGRIKPGGTKDVSKRIHFVDKSTQRKESGTNRLIITVNGGVLEERQMEFQREAGSTDHD